MKNNTIRTYASISREAIEYVQFDQGEDRWLCTLLLQRGYRVEYSAASDAYTHCPESFAEFYTQRRRWAPSTMANIMDLLINYKKTIECNDNISSLYISYQVLLMIGTVLGPGTIFLMIVGAMVTAFGISNWQSFIINFAPIVAFILICFYAKNDTQILVAQVMSALYALLMTAVLVSITLQMVEEGLTSPSAIFILAMTASFVIAALAHPQEFWCVAHGFVYFLSIPSMYLLLALYSFANLHVISWGTREVLVKKSKKQLEEERLQAQAVVKKTEAKSGLLSWMNIFGEPKHQDEEGSISFGFANLFRCLCCTYPKPDPSAVSVLRVEGYLKDISQQIGTMKKQMDATTNSIRRKSIARGLKEPHLAAVTEDEDVECGEMYDQDQTDDAEEHTYNQPDYHEHWLSDPSLSKSATKRLFDEEKTFWNQLIETYLHPLEDNQQKKAQVSAQLLELRNKVIFGVLMVNSLFILIVSLLQMKKDSLHIEWPLNGKANITYLPRLREIRIEMEYLHLEPINLVLVFFFTLILVIQFIAMLFHRLETLSHILASTDVVSSSDKDAREVNFTRITNLLQRQGLRDEEDEAPLIPNEERPMLGVPFQETDGVAGNMFPDRDCISLGVESGPNVERFRSLSVAMQLDLQKILQRDTVFASKVRRMSRNPTVLEDLRRRTSVFVPNSSRAGTPQASCYLASGFGTLQSRLPPYPPRPRSRDTETVHSIELSEFGPPSQPTFVKAGLGDRDEKTPPSRTGSLRRKLEATLDSGWSEEDVV